MPETLDVVTAAQLRALHAAGRQRGLGHEELRAVCGVQSLKDLTRDQAGQFIDRLNNDRPAPRRYKQRARRGLDPGEIRHQGDATSRQRRTIHYLFNRLGWSDATRTHWLDTRYGVDYAQLNLVWIDRAVATEIINALDAADNKPKAGSYKPEAGGFQLPASSSRLSASNPEVPL